MSITESLGAVVRPQDTAEIKALCAWSRRERVPLTFRAAGTSLSGQAITDGVLVDLSRHWRTLEILDDGARVRVGPGIEHNAYRTLLALRFVLPSGTEIDTAAAEAEETFAAKEPAIARQGRSTPRGTNPREVPDEEHDGLRVERVPRFRHAAFDPVTSARRLRRDPCVPALAQGLPGDPRVRARRAGRTFRSGTCSRRRAVMRLGIGLN